jgi:hypothetical protein
VDLLVVGNLGVDQMRRRSHIGVVDGGTNPVGIIDNAVQPIVNIIGRGLSKDIIEPRDIVGNSVKHSILHNDDTLTVVAKFIEEEVGEWAGLQIQDSIEPMFIIIKVIMVKYGQVPVRVASPDNMGGRLSHSASVYGRMLLT